MGNGNLCGREPQILGRAARPAAPCPSGRAADGLPERDNGRGRHGWLKILGIDPTPRSRYRSYIARLERIVRSRSDEDNYLRGQLDLARTRIGHLSDYVLGLEETNDQLNGEVIRLRRALYRHRGSDGRFVSRNTPTPQGAGATQMTGAPKKAGIPLKAGIQQAAEVPKKSEAPKKAEIPPKAGIPQATEAPKKAGIPQKADTPQAAGAPKKAGIPPKAGIPQATEAPPKISVPQPAGGSAGRRNAGIWAEERNPSES